MDIIEKLARAFVSERGGNPDENVEVGTAPERRSFPRWKLEVEWAERFLIAHRVLGVEVSGDWRGE